MKNLVWIVIALVGPVSSLALGDKADAGEPIGPAASPKRPTAEVEGPKLIGADLVGRASDADPALYRVLLQNTSKAPLTVKYLTAGTRPVNTEDPDVLWWRADPPVIPHGQYGEVRVKMASPKQSLTTIRLHTAEGADLTAELPDKPSTLRLCSVKLDHITSTLCAYWQHSSAQIETLAEVAIDGRAVGKEVCPEGRIVPPGLVQCFAVRLKDKLAPGERHLLSFRTESGASLDALFRVPPRFQIGLMNGPGLLGRPSPWVPANPATQTPKDPFDRPALYRLGSCLTHYPGKPQANAWAALRELHNHALKAPEQMAVLHCCEERQDEGLDLFGALADAISVNPWELPVPTRLRRDWQGPMLLLDHARKCAAPNGVYAVVPVQSTADDRLWFRTLQAIALGCSGVLYQPTGKAKTLPEADVVTALETRLRPLALLLPSLDATESLGSMSSLRTNAAGTVAWLTQMGPCKLAVTVVSVLPEPKEQPVKVWIPIPQGRRVQRVLDLAGQEIASLSTQDKLVEIDLKSIRDGTVLIIELTAPEGLGQGF